jgi:DNA invertase Pin-like site-specific DNA recombinase
MRFVGYTRVSDKEQAQKGYSIEAQKEAIEQWAIENNHRLVKIFEDAGRSGSKPSKLTRPVFESAIAYILAGGADGLVVKWMDRFARNVGDYLRVMAQLNQAGKQLVSISEPLFNGDPSDPVGRYIAVSAMNAYQLQAELSGLKAAQGRERRAKQGHYPGTIPIGYQRQEAEIVIHPRLGPMIANSFGEFSTGRYTLGSWVIEARRREYYNTRGEVIRKGGWHRIFRNRFYIGRYTWKGHEYLGNYEPLVSESIFQTVQDILDAHGPGQSHTRRFWLLSNLLWSDSHSKLMTGAVIKGQFSYYRASTKGLPEHNVKAEEIEGRVIGRLQHIKWTGERLYDIPEDWRLGFKMAKSMAEIYPHLTTEKEKQDFLRLIFFKKGIRVSAGGAILGLDLKPGFEVDVRL